MGEIFLLILAAALEVGGDALIRIGLQRGGVLLMLSGAVVLIAYGFMVNLTKLDFSRLMGLYIVIFFCVAQIVSLVFFREKLHPAVIVGGIFILMGGMTMAVWR